MTLTKNKFFDKYRRENFLKIFKSSIDKRLRELDYPGDVDCERWVWELIQNSKDSIVGLKDREGVDIEITVEKNIKILAKDVGLNEDYPGQKITVDKYTFKHNGAPFIDKTLYALIYKFSEGKSDNSESTGRFGTGFLTTHSLSKIVNISGDIISDGEVHGFTITMFREGEKEDLLKGLDRTEESFRLREHQPFGWTSYEYITKWPRNKEAGQLGIKNFKQNISKVMLFCPEIRSIKLNEDGRVLTIERGTPFKDPMDPTETCERLPLVLYDGEKHFTKTFLYVKMEEDNTALRDRLKYDSPLKICCAIEIDNDNNIFVDTSSPSLFCTLPLVGSEKHQLPFIINSPNFEPNSERQAIILEGSEYLDNGKLLSDAGINKMILTKSMGMFESLLQCIRQDDTIKSRFLLTRGLRVTLNNDEIEKFDHDWYEENFTKPMRHILINSPIVWNGKTFVKLIDICLPWFKQENYHANDEVKKLGYEFISKIFHHNVPTFEETLNFENNIWEGDSEINYITIENCIKKLSEYGNMNTLAEKIDFADVWEWMDNFLLFIKEHHPTYLQEYPIIPNMSGDFVQLTNDLTTSKDVPDNMIECMESLGIPWKSNHIHKNIVKYNPGTDHNINYAVSEIKNIFNEWSNDILKLISYIPNDHEDKTFIQKRRTIYQLCSVLWDDSIPRGEKNGNRFPKELWDGIDDIVFEELIRKIENKKTLGDDLTIDYMKQFLECVSRNYSEFKNHSIVPNQNGKFRKIGNLFIDANIPLPFKQSMKKYFGVDIKNELIDDQLASIESLISNRYKSISDYIEILNDCFKSKYHDEKSKQEAARILITIIPKIDESNKEEKEDDWQSYQRKLFEIFQIFTKRNDPGTEIERTEKNKELWYNVNKYIYNDIKAVIERYQDVGTLVNDLGKEKTMYYEYLKIITEVSSVGKIIPNQYEELCDLNKIKLYNEGKLNDKTNKIEELIPEKLKDIIMYLGFDVRKRLVHPNMHRMEKIKDELSYTDIGKEIDDRLKSFYYNSSKTLDKNLKWAVENLLEYQFTGLAQNTLENEKLQIFREIYVNNARDKLSKLENPSDAERKRWIWQLIQIAINNTPSNTGANIKITVKDNRYIFKYNGIPFTTQSLMDLLYTFNAECRDNSSDHLGTIFLNTHSLSKVINISGDVDWNGQTKGFSITMNREGNNQNSLLNSLKETENNFCFKDERHGYTSFEYITNEKNKKSGLLGIQNLRDNISKVMLSCPEINSITLDDNGQSFEIHRGKNGNNNDDSSSECKELVLHINDNDQDDTKTFVCIKKDISIKEYKDKLSNLQIYCAVELDKYNNIHVNHSSPCLFRSFPIIGYENYKLPFIINCVDFELDSEGQFILSNDHGNDEKVSINKVILEKSIHLFETILKYIKQNNRIKKRHLLTEGLRSIPNKNDNNETFDAKWYEEMVIKPIRNILINYPVVWNGEQFMELKNIYLPVVSSYDDEHVEKHAYELISQAYNNQVPTFEESLIFENCIWESDPNIKYISMNECVHYLSNFGKVNNLCNGIQSFNNRTEKALEWMDELLSFINDHHPSYLRKYNIIPNMNGDFVSLSNHLATSNSVPDNMIECLEFLGNDWKSNHVHKSITNYSPGIDHNINSAIWTIKKDYNEWPIQKILILISYIPNDKKDEKLTQNRRTIYQLCSSVWENNILIEMNGNGFPKEIWDGIDDMVFKELIKKIENKKTLGGDFTIDYMAQFLKCISVSQKFSEFKDHSIIPNQNGEFCKSNDLFIDANIPSPFKECMNEYFGIDIKKALIDNKLTSIESLISNRYKSISDYIEIINGCFKSGKYNEKSKQEAARILITIIPKKDETNKDKENDWQNNQRKLFEIFQIFTKRNDLSFEIERTERNKELWYYINKYIYNDIKTIIERYQDVESLLNDLGIEKSKYYEYMNIIIKIFPTKNITGKIIPNQYEELCELIITENGTKKQNLYNEGILNTNDDSIELISESLKDIAKKLDEDVRNKLIHSSINRISDIHSYSESDVYGKIAKIIEINNNDPTKKSDPEYNKLLESLGELNFKKMKNNPFDDNMLEIFGNVLLSNISNRLRELDNPSDEDCKRIFYELIQNAKDSIVGQEDRTDVDIEISVEKDVEFSANDIGISEDKDDSSKYLVDKYIFKHNGSPFTDKTLNALLFKYSKGKADNSESTGRFGTGFLTTHSLSKTVKISGDIYSDGQLKGFTVVMNREGKGEELLKRLKETKKSIKEFPIDFHQWTTYEYLAKTEINKKAGKLGIQNLKENITKVMLFCPEIKSIKLNDNGSIFEIKRDNNNSNEIIIGECQKMVLNVKDGNSNYTRSFIYIKQKELNSELSDKFDTKRYLRICCAIEIDNDNKIFVDESSPSLFCTLPLIGSEKLKLPFILDSPDFEPDSERQSIPLHGANTNENENKISDSGINRMILQKAQILYEELLKYICQDDTIKERYLLTRGLCVIPDKKEIKNFDNEWYEENFIKPMRNILIKYPIVWNDETFVKITDIYLPWFKYEKYNNNVGVKKLAYEFISQIFHHNVPTFKETLNFENNIWEDDSEIKYTTTKKCTEKLSEYEKINILIKDINFENVWSWIDEFLLFIDKHHHSYLQEHPIIPNLNEEFVKLIEELTTSKCVPDNMIECVENLGIPWKSNHIHKNIVKYNPGTDHNINYAVSEIKNIFNEWSNDILKLISYIPNDHEDKTFVQKRRTIYQLCSVLWDDSIPRGEKNGNGFPKELWDGIDDIVFEELVRKIENKKTLGDDLTIGYMKQFLECVSRNYSEFKNHSIVPNQNGKFCIIRYLFVDDNIPLPFKQSMKKYFDVDIKNELIDDQLASIESLISNRYKSISDYIEIINGCFKSGKYNEKSKQEAARILITIIPKKDESNKEEKEEDDWQSYQRKLFEIFQIFTKRNDPIIEIERTERNKVLWYYVNKYIYNDIKTVIERYQDVESLLNDLGIEKSKYYEYMNIIIKIFPTKNITGKIIPNQYEELCELKITENGIKKHNLYNEGIPNTNDDSIELISESSKDIAKTLDYDVRKILIHLNINRIPDIPEITEWKVNEEIAKIIEEINEKNITKRSDQEFIKILDSLNVRNFKIMRNNPFNDKNMMEIFNNVLIANIRNRLRDLDNPSDEDCERSFYELIQNAKDSIVGQKDRTDVDIEISVEKDVEVSAKDIGISEDKDDSSKYLVDKYTFKHNGSPFTDKTLPALLYKYSKGKAENSESTGRFGTGFLTTHSLSKIVNISGDIYSDGQLKGFKVTLYREGQEDKELLEGLNKTNKSYKEFPIDFHQWTTYEYLAKTEINKKAGKLGIQNLKENITKVMLFCPEIKSIKLNDNGIIFEIKRDNNNNNNNNEIIIGKCQKIVLNVKDGNNNYTRSFIYIKQKELNSELSNRFKRERYLRICCAIEIDNDNKIFVDESSPSLFCTLPLIGSEKLKLPFILDSPDFEPDSERQSIPLHGADTNEKTKKISDSGINKMILQKAQILYEELLKYICQDDTIKERYLLTRGLCVIPGKKEIKNFDNEWYEENFIKPMRNILIKYSIVWNGERFAKLTDICLPWFKYENYNNNNDIKRLAYDFISKIFHHKVPTFEETLNFENNIWEDDSEINYTTTEKFTEHLSEYKNMSILAEKNDFEDEWKWMDEFLLFIDKHHPSYLCEYSIIPNMNGNFIQLTNDITSCKEVPDSMIECLNDLKDTWKIKHIHKNITKYTFGIGHTIDDAIIRIHSNLRELSQYLIVVSYIPGDNENEEYFQKRQTIYELCSVTWENLLPNKKNGNEFPEKIWDIIDKYIFENLIKVIEDEGKLGEKYTIEYMKKFLECITKFYPFFKYHKIIPNKNGKFCLLNELYEDNVIPLFKECMLKYFKFDINEELIDDILISIKSFKKIPQKTISNYVSKLNYYFEHENDIDETVKESIAKCLIRIIPKKEENNNNDDWQNNQRIFYDIYKIFTNINEESIEIERNEKNKRLWRYVNLYIFKEIRTIIERYNYMEELSKYLNTEKSVLFNYIKMILEISSEGKIIPNQNEEFCEKNNLFYEEEPIPEEFKDVIKLKDISKNLGWDVKNILIHESIGRLAYLSLDDFPYTKICYKIDGFIKEKFEKYMEEKSNDSNEHLDTEFRTAAKDLIEIYFDEIGDKNAQIYFPLTYPLKEHILLDVVYTKETRKNMMKLVKNKDEDFLSKLLENNNICELISKGIIQDNSDMIELLKMYGLEFFTKLKNCPEILTMILNNELNDKIFKKFINNENEGIKYTAGSSGGITKFTKLSSEQSINKEISKSENINKNSRLISEKYDDDTLEKIINNPEVINMIKNDTLNDENVEQFINREIGESEKINKNSRLISEKYDDDTIDVILKNPEVISMMKNNDFVDTCRYYYDLLNQNEKTGYSGEAYIYELLEELRRSGQIKSVEWKTLSKSGHGKELNYKGKTYYLIIDGSHYDIVVETNNGRKIYIEVKTTSKCYDGRKVPFFLSQYQIETMKNIAYPDEYILAIVFDINNYPKHFFMNLKSNIIKNRICDDENHQYLIELESQYGEKNIIDLLKNREIDDNLELNGSNKDYDNYPLFNAIKNKNIEEVKKLIENGEADVNYENEEGDTPLIIACKSEIVDEDIVKYLIKNGANVNMEDINGDTPLTLSCKHSNNENIVKYLIRKGANIYKENNDINTLLKIAKEKNNEKLIDYLNNIIKNNEELFTKKIKSMIKNDDKYEIYFEEFGKWHIDDWNQNQFNDSIIHSPHFKIGNYIWRFEIKRENINDDEEYYSFYLRNLDNFEYIYLNYVFYILNYNDYSNFKAIGSKEIKLYHKGNDNKLIKTFKSESELFGENNPLIVDKKIKIGIYIRIYKKDKIGSLLQISPKDQRKNKMKLKISNDIQHEILEEDYHEYAIKWDDFNLPLICSPIFKSGKYLWKIELENITNNKYIRINLVNMDKFGYIYVNAVFSIFNDNDYSKIIIKEFPTIMVYNKSNDKNGVNIFMKKDELKKEFLINEKDKKISIGVFIRIYKNK